MGPLAQITSPGQAPGQASSIFISFVPQVLGFGSFCFLFQLLLPPSPIFHLDSSQNPLLIYP